MSVQHLNHHHARILEEIFEHRGRNIEWPDVVALVQHLGSALERHDGKYEFQIGQTKEVFAKPHHKDVTVQELVDLRRFFAQAGVDPNKVTARPRGTAFPSVVVLVDHIHARFFEPQPNGDHLEETGHLQATDTQDLRRQLKEGQLEGERAEEARAFYDRIVQRIGSASSIMLIGDASGKSSGMIDFLEYLKERYKEVADRIVATADADLSSITLPEIERLAARPMSS